MLFKYLKTEKYIQFSSISTYPMLNMSQKESHFNPADFEAKNFQDKLAYLTAGNAKYQLGKRAAEKAALKHGANTVIIRIPSVAGKDALNPMLKSYAEAVANGEEIKLDRNKYERKFAVTTAKEPGKFAVYALKNDLKGIYNVASDGYISNQIIVNSLEKILDKKENISWGETNECFHVDFPEHTLDTTKAKNAGFQFSSVDRWLFEVLDFFCVPYKDKKNIPENKVLMKKNSLLTSMADVVYRFMKAYEYGGELFEYLKDYGINDFDLYVEEEAIKFIPVLLNNAKWMPDHIYAPIEKKENVKTSLSGKNYMEIMPIDMAVKREHIKSMVFFPRWNYWTFKRISDLNYKNITFGQMADYSLYKNVILENCGKYLENKGARCFFTKFPQANRIKNPSPLEKYLANNSIYGFVEESVKYGLDKEEIFAETAASTIEVNGVYKCMDRKSEHCNIVNGFRVTTDDICKNFAIILRS